jgi:hypothetical protein
MAKKKKSKPNQNPSAGIDGSQRPLSVVGYAGLDQSKRYDLEIEENIVRQDRRGITREIVEAYQYCYEIDHTLTLAVNAVYGSTDGDDQGFTIAPDFNYGTAQKPDFTPIDKWVYDCGLDIIRRQSWPGEYVIGGDKLKLALKQWLGYGDTFLEIGLEKDGAGYTVGRTLFLPTFEMFRKEEDNGYLTGFEQRRYLDDKEAIQFPAWKIIHLRRNQQHLYGKSEWKTSVATGIWAKLKQITHDLAIAANDIGINPNVHMFDLMNSAGRDAYIASHEANKLNGVVTDLYMLPGADIKKLGSQNPNLQTLIDVYLQWRFKMMLPGWPLYLFPGTMTGSARELSAQPAFQHARLRNEYCNALTQIIRQVIDTEIKLKRGEEFWRKTGQFYRIVWPQWNMSALVGGQAGANDDETSAAGISDLDMGGVGSEPVSQRSLKDFDLLVTNGRH